MLDPTLTAAAVVTVVAALGGVSVQIINARSAATDRRLAAEERRMLMQKADNSIAASLANGQKSDVIIEKAVQIHTLTDGNLSKITASLEVANAKIHGMEKLVASMIAAKDATAHAAQAAGMAAATAAVQASFANGTPDRRVGKPPVAQLDVIQSTTEDIDGKVDEIKDATTHPPANAGKPQ